jgi:hypothetical protein
MLYVLWTQATQSSMWLPTSQVCLGPEEAARPQVTPDLVLNEVRRIGLPALQVHVQPAGDTLVNLDTIFYAEPLPFVRTVQLLGYTVDVDATPTAYDWSFGDGTGQVTESPGAPYPAGDITHAYTDAHVTQQASVDATYTVRFRVDGGEWQTIEEPSPLTGRARLSRSRRRCPSSPVSDVATAPVRPWLVNKGRRAGATACT